MLTDLELAYNALAAKQQQHTRIWRYYDGNQPLVYNSERLREVFNNINARFIQNWCAVVVDSVLERIQLTGFQVGNDRTAAKELATLWTDSELDIDADDAHLAALVTGESFVIVWPDDVGEPQAYYNDPRLCVMFYDPENPRERRMAAKWWIGEDGKRYLTLYYSDRLEHFVSTAAAEDVHSADAFQPTEEPSAENPYGEIPVFHFRRERRGIISELANALTLQDAINKLLADMMVAAEFGAYRQRYVISGADTSQLQNLPGKVWDLAAGDGQGQATSAGEFSETNLTNYLDAIDRLATSVAIITRTPKHYFFAQDGDPSGEALIAMEAPLNKKAARYIKRMGVVWRQVAAFMTRVSKATVDIEARQITAQFADPATIQPRTKAEIVQLQTSSGMPLVTALREAGWSETQLAQLDQDQQAAAAAQQTTLAQAMLRAQREFDAGDNGNNGGGQ